MKKKTLFKKSKIDADDYTNINTGKTLAEDYPEITSVNERQELKIVSYDEYFVMDSKALSFIKTVLNQSDLGRVMLMANMVEGSYNILHNKKDNSVHTHETLAEELAYARSAYTLFMQKLFKHSIINYTLYYKNGKKRTAIALNPTLARKRKTFHEDCLKLFEDLTIK